MGSLTQTQENRISLNQQQSDKQCAAAIVLITKSDNVFAWLFHFSLSSKLHPLLDKNDFALTYLRIIYIVIPSTSRKYASATHANPPPPPSI